MEFLRFLEMIRGYVGVVLDPFFSIITYLGDEIAFLVIAILFFWCINKRAGYYILVSGVVGSVLNQWLKIGFKIDRPWDLDPTFHAVESAKGRATGYSFPSGHTQNIAGTFGCVGFFYKRRWLGIVCGVIIALVSFSRMYLGVHTPKDVIVALIMAFAFVVLFNFVFKTEEAQKRYMDLVVICSVILSIGYIIVAFMQKNPEDPNVYNAQKHASTLVGCLIALAVVYPLDKYLIKFETSARWYSQVIKFVIGVSVNLFIKAGLEDPLVAIFFNNEFLARGVRYFIIVVFSGVVWPLTFKFFRDLRIPFMERFTEKLVAKFRGKSKTGTSSDKTV